MSVADKLQKAGGSGGKGTDFPPAKRIQEFDGQTLTVVSIKKVPSKLAKSGFSILATALVNGEEEVTFWTTPNSGNQLAAIEQDLPQDLTVESFDTDYGQKGYKFTLA